jgi:hypothetical protein
MWSIPICLLIGFIIVFIWYNKELGDAKDYFREFGANALMSVLVSILVFGIWFTGTGIGFSAAGGQGNIEKYTLSDTDTYFLEPLAGEDVYFSVSSNEYLISVKEDDKITYKSIVADKDTIVTIKYDKYAEDEKPQVFYDYYKGGTSWFAKNFTFYQYIEEMTVVTIYVPEGSIATTIYSLQ